MPRILIAVLSLGFLLLQAGCIFGGGSEVRFSFEVPDGKATVDIDDGDIVTQSGTVFELDTDSEDVLFELKYQGKTVYGRMDVREHTDLTRMSSVQIHITAEMLEAVADNKVVTYVSYQRRPDAARSRSGGEGYDAAPRDYGDTISRAALIEQAGLRGEVIAVIDFGNAPYKD